MGNYQVDLFDQKARKQLKESREPDFYEDYRCFPQA